MYFSNGTNQSCGVMTLIGDKLQFNLVENIIDKNGRYISTKCTINDSEFMLVNVYGPNTETEQVKFYSKFLHKIIDLQLPNDTSIIIGGDFNVCLTKIDTDRDDIKFKFKSIEIIGKILEELDLCDIYRIRNPSIKQYTWRRTQPLCQRRIDYIFIPNSFQSAIANIKIIPSVNTDHSAVMANVISTSYEKHGPSYWRFNNSLITDKNYIESMRDQLKILENDYTNYDLDPRIKWEFLKYKIRSFTINYCKQKSKAFKNDRTILEEKVKTLEETLQKDSSSSVIQEYKDSKDKLEECY